MFLKCIYLKMYIFYFGFNHSPNWKNNLSKVFNIDAGSASLASFQSCLYFWGWVAFWVSFYVRERGKNKYLHAYLLNFCKENNKGLIWKLIRSSYLWGKESNFSKPKSDHITALFRWFPNSLRKKTKALTY